MPNLIANLAQQLIHRRAVVPEELSSLHATNIRQRTRPSPKECFDLLQSQVLLFAKTFVVIDALDELPESNGTRARLIAEIRKLRPPVHLLVTSRHDASIEHIFDSENAACIEILARDEDIKRYLDSQIQCGRLKRNVGNDTQLRDLITDTIVAGARGMYVPNNSIFHLYPAAC